MESTLMTSQASSEAIDGSRWKYYSDERPPEGVYDWRIPSISLPGEYVIVAAAMRIRGAGWDNTLSPQFDHWNGYQVIVPDRLQWSPAACERGKPIYADLIAVEGLEFSACIYCGKQPKLHGCQQIDGGRGVIVNGKPWLFNSWWLSCCRWGETPHISSPFKIEEMRLAALEIAAGMLAARKGGDA